MSVTAFARIFPLVVLCGLVANVRSVEANWVDYYPGISYCGHVSDDEPAGIGTSHHLLTLDGGASGTGGSQWGGVTWDGTGDVVENPTHVVTTSEKAAAGSSTASFGTLRSLGSHSTDLRLFLDVDQAPGEAMGIDHFELFFYSSDSSAPQFQIGHQPAQTLKLSEVGAAAEEDWDHCFDVDLGPYADDFDAGGDDWRMGMRVYPSFAMSPA